MNESDVSTSIVLRRAETSRWLFLLVFVVAAIFNFISVDERYLMSVAVSGFCSWCFYTAWTGIKYSQECRNLFASGQILNDPIDIPRPELPAFVFSAGGFVLVILGSASLVELVTKAL